MNKQLDHIDYDIERIDTSGMSVVSEPEKELEAPKLPEPKEPRTKKRGFFIWIREFLAGENKAGKIGSILKNIAAPWVPGGRAIDKLTDHIGNKLKSRKSKTESTMIKAKDPKTTITGIITILVGIGLLFGIDLDNLDPEQIAVSITPILVGLGLLGSRDNKRKEEAE